MYETSEHLLLYGRKQLKNKPTVELSGCPPAFSYFRDFQKHGTILSDFSGTQPRLPSSMLQPKTISGCIYFTFSGLAYSLLHIHVFNCSENSSESWEQIIAEIKCLKLFSSYFGREGASLGFARYLGKLAQC